MSKETKKYNSDFKLKVIIKYLSEIIKICWIDLHVNSCNNFFIY